MPVRASPSPAPPRRPCRRSRISPAIPDVAHYVAAGLADSLGPGDYYGRRPPGRGEARQSEKMPPSCRAARGAPRGDRPRPGGRASTCCCSTSPPTISTCRPSNGWRTRLSAWKGARVLVSHDRRFLANLTRAVLWLDRGIVRRLDKGYARVRRLVERNPGARGNRAAQARPPDRARDRMGGQKRSARAARATRAACASWVSCGKQRRQQIGPTGRATIEAGTAEQSGALAITARNISKRFGERTIVENFSTRIFRRDRMGLIGPNGAGKTTLAAHADRRPRARHRLGEARRQPGARGDRPAPRRPRS